jgi:hypothetical protein
MPQDRPIEGGRVGGRRRGIFGNRVARRAAAAQWRESERCREDTLGDAGELRGPKPVAPEIDHSGCGALHLECPNEVDVRSAQYRSNFLKLMRAIP